MTSDDFLVLRVAGRPVGRYLTRPEPPARLSPRRCPYPVATGTASAAPRRERTIHIAGDSTAARKHADAAPETGWGMALPFFLRSGLTVANHAANGRSSKSFIDEGRLDVILAALRPGDFLIAQFGHNDSKIADPTRYTEPWTTYQDCLRQYVDGVRAKGALGGPGSGPGVVSRGGWPRPGHDPGGCRSRPPCRSVSGPACPGQPASAPRPHHRPGPW